MSEPPPVQVGDFRRFADPSCGDGPDTYSCFLVLGFADSACGQDMRRVYILLEGEISRVLRESYITARTEPL